MPRLSWRRGSTLGRRPRAGRRTGARHRGDGRHRRPGGRHRARRRRAARRSSRAPPSAGSRAGWWAPWRTGCRRCPTARRCSRPTSRARSRSSASRGWWPCCARRGCPAAIVWGAVVATHVILLLGPPLSLTDVFNYLHYGRMPATYGVNPYAALPLTVRQDPAYHFSNWHHLPSPYGPLFTLRHRGPRSAVAARRVLGVEGRAAGRRARHPRAGGVHRAPARPLPAGRGRPRRPEPARARLRHRRRAQRAARAAVQRRRGLAGGRRLAGRDRAVVGRRRGRLRRPGRGLQAVGGPARARRRPRLPPAPARPGGCGQRRRAGPRASSGWSTAATCPRRASRTDSSAR